MTIDKSLLTRIISDITEMGIQNYIIGGSASLFILGLINRDVHDIDIFTYETSDFLRNKQHANKHNHLYRYSQRCFEQNGIWYDIFSIHNGILRYIEVEYNGIKLRVMNPLETYNMKLLSKKRIKQKQDFEALKMYKLTGRLKTL